MSNSQAQVGQYQYDLRLINYDLMNLVGSYEAFETLIINDIVSFFIKELESQGGIPQGNLISIDGLPYKLSTDQINFERVFTLYLTPCDAAKAKLINSDVNVNHFGRIKKIRVRWPTVLKRKYESLPALLRKCALDAYIALLVVFVAKYSQLEGSLLKNLYEILNIHILQANKPELVNKSWFTITNIRTGQFHYFFSRDRLENMLKVLINHQVREFSPFELATCLITDEAADTFLELGMTTNKKFSSLPFIKLTSVTKQFKHWVGESNLYQASDISIKEICTHKDFCLLINCPTKLAPELEQIVVVASSNISDQFQKNLKEYNSFRKVLTKLTKPVRQSSAYDAIKDFTSDVISKTISEMIKQ